MGVDRRIILKLMLKEEAVRIRTVLFYLGMGTLRSFSEKGNAFSDSTKLRNFLTV
jgi:hypothetical protein